jgi:PAS domain S-box-containing protein
MADHKSMDIPHMSPEEVRELVHELRTHQIELELQNEELRRAQDALVKSRDRYSNLYDFAPVGYVTVSHKGLILEANLSLATMLGVERSALVKQPFSAFVIPEDEDICYLHRRGILKTRQRDACRLRMRTRNGEPFWAEMDSIPIEADDEGDIRLRTTIRDITERLRLEARLTQSQKMESIGRLAGGVAHDFNNLLMGIMNYVELCRDALGPDHPVREWLDEITSDAERSAGIARQLLAFARRQPIAPKALDLNDTISGMIKMLRRLIGEDILLTWHPGAGVWTVKMDPGQVDQLLANLATNARDAIGGVGTLTIETANATIDEAYCAANTEATPGEYAVLAVSDDGTGMDRDTLERIFEPFYSTGDASEHAGLGLATVYGIVKQNGGFVNVSSERGEGATFKVYLPRHAHATVATSEPESATAGVVGGDETILLCEDEKSIRVTVLRFLQDRGYTVLAAETPDEALRLAAEYVGDIQLLVTDVILPGMNGHDLADVLMKQYPQMRCIFTSGYTANAIAHHGVLDPGVVFLEKPVSSAGLAAKIREVLDGDKDS